MIAGLIGLLLLCGMVRFSPVFAINDAADKIAITMSPTKQRLELEPGKTITSEVVVMNDGTLGSQIRVYATPYQVQPDYSANNFETDNQWTQITRWITFGPENQTELILNLPASARETVQFTVKVPTSVPFGGQYAAIMAETMKNDTGSGVQAIHRVASLVYSEVAGNTIKQGDVISRDWRGWYQESTITTSLMLKNSGNVDFAADNTLIIKDLISGKVICEEKPNAATLLPETERKIELNCDVAAAVGLYNVTQQSSFFDQIIEETRVVLVMPIYIIVLILVVIAVLVTLLIIMIKNKLRKRKGRTT